MVNLYRNQGFTVVETLITMGLLAIIALAAIPSWNDFVKKKELINATEAIYDTLKLAYSESTKRNTDITVSFISGTNWCVGLSDVGDCDCKTGTCTIQGVTHVIDSTSYSGINLSVTDLTSSKYVTFEGIRGLASNSGTVTLMNSPYSIVLSVNKIGLLKACSNNVSGYSVC